ncbi:acyl-CoA dehydrogenase [Nocardia sp. NPDC051321]|uniref:acyl-CoA dehydrogenase n=1 Tax=Nocardia sp. NPDC051321 TaxID=3364323 RepID=UPI0037BC2CCE
MSHFRSNVRDLEFNLFESLSLGGLLDSGAFGDLDSETVRTMLDEVRRLAEGPLGASHIDADRNPPVFDPATFSVRLPESFKQSFGALQNAGWAGVGNLKELGGLGAPAVVNWSIAEMILGAAPAAYIYATGSAFLNALHKSLTDEQKRWSVLMSAQNWGGTMALTEADAGSDVGAGRTKAIEQQDGSWHIEGTKRFITNGDSDDLFPNIVHLVLARPEGAVAGTKGLSLFLVPKFDFDHDTGALGERNGVFATNLEHKMGLKVSATCEVTFGGNGIPAKGWLVGETHNGIAQMFEVIRSARMMVGVKATATLSSAYLHALGYAKTRVQGADLSQMADKSAPRVAITHHPDVRRSLILQKAYAEGLRAVYMYTAAHGDPVVAEHVSGADATLAAGVNDLLLPIVKGVGSERAYQYLTESLQTFGGSGYLQDYPIEQYIRDAKIDSLYEGTTAIQAQDFFFRKIIRDRGVALAHVAGQVQKFIETEGGNGRLKAERKLLATALEDVQGMVATLTGHLMGAEQDPKELYKIGLGSVRFLMSVGDLLIGWQLLRQAEIAIKALDGAGLSDLRAGTGGGSTEAFYTGKIATAQYFARNILPELTTTRAVLANLDNDIMELDEAAF